jgi:energy-coupling factor transporter ATP-binding protein EcfA2
MVYQETSLVPTLTVAQNLYLGDEKFFNRLRRTYIEAQQILQSLNFPVDPTAIVLSLGAAKRQMVEIARAVRLKAKVIIFDEPTASLTPEEKHHLFALMDRLRKERVSIIFISHALEEALEISDRITILRDGARIITADAKTLTRETIIRHMVGRSLTDELYRRAGDASSVRPPGEKILSVQNLSMQNLVRNTSFSIFAGAGHGHIRTGWLRENGNRQDHRRRRQARLLSWRGRPSRRKVGALPDPAPGGQQRRRLCHRGPKGRRLLRDDVGRGKSLRRTNLEPRVARDWREHE